MKILVINCGSSSLKYQLYNMDNNEVLAKGLVERIGIDGSIFSISQQARQRISMFSNSHLRTIAKLLS